MKIAFGFSSVFYEDDDAVLKSAERTVDAVPVVIVEWEHPGLPAAGDFVDVELLESFAEVPREVVELTEYKVEYVYWTIHENEPIPMVQLRGQ